MSYDEFDDDNYNSKPLPNFSNKKKTYDTMSEDYIEKPIASREERSCWGLNPLAAITTKFIKKSTTFSSKGSFLEKDIVINWKDIVGEDWCERIKPLNLVFKSKNYAILEIALSSSSLAGIMHYEKPTLLAKINGFCGKDLVKDIKFIHGR